LARCSVCSPFSPVNALTRKPTPGGIHLHPLRPGRGYRSRPRLGRPVSGVHSMFGRTPGPAKKREAADQSGCPREEDENIGSDQADVLIADLRNRRPSQQASPDVVPVPLQGFDPMPDDCLGEGSVLALTTVPGPLNFY
jgi:hypothetical protein